MCYKRINSCYEFLQVAIQCVELLLFFFKPLMINITFYLFIYLLLEFSHTESDSSIFDVIFDTASPTFFTSLMKPAPLKADVPFALGS